MDIFKLLSRSTKVSKNNAVPTPKLPSAGTSANPQLYHDEVRSTKRKADDSINASSVTADDNANFFASKSDCRKAKKQKKKAVQKESAHTHLTSPALLPEEECRVILKSHRIKIMVLPLQAPETERERKRRLKRAKEGKASKKRTKKEEAKQIYPQPLQDFTQLQRNYGISKRLSENVVREGYKIPTEVQMGALPLLIESEVAINHQAQQDFQGEQSGIDDSENAGVDLLSVAPTGSGKTLAFLLPTINMMVQRRRTVADKSHELQAVIIAPTRELVSQIVNEGRKLADGTGVKVVEMIKGMRLMESHNPSTSDVVTKIEDSGDEVAFEERVTGSYEEPEERDDDVDIATSTDESKKSRRPSAKADMLVTTPLALLNALSNSFLPTIKHLVLDEADVLLDPLFRDQTLGIWHACTNPRLRVSLWSATMGSSIESLALNTIATRRIRLSLPAIPATPIIRLVIGLKDSAIPNISHKMIYAGDTEKGKLLALRQLLRPSGPSALNSDCPALRPPFLVFVQTIPRAIALHAELLYDIPAEAGGSSRLAVLHSDLSPTIRSSIMSRFRAGEIWILITTDILSRGVDFRGINGVVNFDIPNSGATYVHRVGRTGRAGRDGGVAITLYTKEDVPYVRDVAMVIAESEKAAGKTAGGVQKWLLDALPKVSKKDRQEIKVRGIAARRVPASDITRGAKNDRGRISSKSGYERKVENRRKGAIEGSKRRKEAEFEGGLAEPEDEWGGIGE